MVLFIYLALPEITGILKIDQAFVVCFIIAISYLYKIFYFRSAKILHLTLSYINSRYYA